MHIGSVLSPFGSNKLVWGVSMRIVFFVFFKPLPLTHFTTSDHMGLYCYCRKLVLFQCLCANLQTVYLISKTVSCSKWITLPISWNKRGLFSLYSTMMIHITPLSFQSCATIGGNVISGLCHLLLGGIFFGIQYSGVSLPGNLPLPDGQGHFF